jgi:hypothetical protein
LCGGDQAQRVAGFENHLPLSSVSAVLPKLVWEDHVFWVVHVISQLPDIS